MEYRMSMLLSAMYHAIGEGGGSQLYCHKLRFNGSLSLSSHNLNDQGGMDQWVPGMKAEWSCESSMVPL